MSEIASVYSSSKPKARKEHKCCECRGVIQPGEHCHIFSGFWDTWQSFKTCDDCDKLRAEVDKDIAHREDASPFSELYETVFESREPKWVAAYMATKRKRGAKIHDWMIRREAEILSQHQPT